MSPTSTLATRCVGSRGFRLRKTRAAATFATRDDAGLSFVVARAGSSWTGRNARIIRRLGGAKQATSGTGRKDEGGGSPLEPKTRFVSFSWEFKPSLPSLPRRSQSRVLYAHTSTAASTAKSAAQATYRTARSLDPFDASSRSARLAAPTPTGRLPFFFCFPAFFPPPRSLLCI